MKTTLKVDSETRDLMKQLSHERALDYDQTIRLAMAALQREARREQMRRESLAGVSDPADLAEAAQVLRDMEDWSAR